MESPERTENIPAPVDQGSPFFKYLCGLSPIKPAKSMHVIQTYAELSLPPPPAVFTSPANPDRCGGRAKRGLLANRTAATQVTVETVSILGNDWVGDKENQPNQLYISRSNAAAQGDGGQSSSQAISEYSQQQHVLCPRLEQGQVGDSTGEHSLRFEYNDVANYLADPSEGGLYAPASSAQLQNSYVRKSSTSEDYSYPREDDDVDKSINDDNLSSDSQDRIHTRDHDTNFSNGGLPELHAISYVRSHQQYLPADRRESLASAASGSSSDHEGSGAEAPSRLDQETAAMASYLLAGDMDFDDGARGDWINSHSSLSKLPHHQTPDFAAYERLSNLAPRSRENFELAGSKAPESQRVVDLDSKNMAMEDRKDVQISGTVGQRGVRRRCLDFETSVRRKSLGGAGSRKSMALRSKTGPGSGGASAASNIPSSILCERAVATSDATNSTVDPAAASDPQSDILLRPRGTSSTKGLSAGLLRVSRCSVQKISESTAGDVCMADPPKISRDCVSVPSGIGLHLNSLTGGISFSPTNREFKQTLGVSPAPKGAVASLLGMTALSGVMHENGPDNFGNNMVGMGNAGSVSKNFSLDSSSGFGSGVMISVMERSRVTLRETIPGTNPGTGVLKATTLQSLTVGGRQSLDGSNNAIVLEKPGSSGKKRIQHQEVPPPPNVDFQDEYDSPRSSKKRRKSPTAAGEKSGDGCKRCNCKKSKCLKLYCECFAAGTYCVGSCTCHDCFNKPEHEETVLSTRQLIESRNPLAFAPKIVHSNDASPKRGEEILETPASARHKRGCNCKKSLCLKKYCECYQAGVGCSEGCRCEGCKNMYGRKEAVEDSDKEIASDVPESGSPEAELELPSAGSEGPVGHIYPLRSNGKDLSPTTPSFQYTGAVCRQGRTIGRVRSATKKRSTSPLSQSQPVGKPSPSPDCLTRSSLGLQSEKSNAQQTPNLQHARISPISTPKLSRGNQLSPRWDGLGDICTLTPLAHPPLRPTPASLSTIDRTGASPSFSCQSIEPISSYQPDNFDSVSKSSPPRFQQAPNLSPLSSFGSRGLQSLSNHPVPTTSCLPSSFDRQGSSKALVVAQSGHLSSLLSDDDDTPDFLKYSAGVNSPITKRGSPKQKRVSPPHLEGVRNTSRDGQIVFNSPAKSSPGLRSGRKFILQALPALPPLLPLSGSSPGQICSNTQKQV